MDDRAAPDSLPEPIARTLEALGARAIRASDSEYPAGLRALRDRPPIVFVRGAIPPVARAVAMVGSRAASPYGREQARRLAADLARLGFTIVSGLARGIDAASHRGALEAGGATVAVLPGGLEQVTPPSHRELAESIVRSGGLLTEWSSGAPVARGVFVRRNRLIAGLAAATVVVEAAERSGALSTAAAARRLGRPLLAVPGDLDRPTSHGTNGLIRDGAFLCEDANDVLRALSSVSRPDAGGSDRGRSAAPDATASQRSTVATEGTASEDPATRLLAVLGDRPERVETLAAAARITMPEVLALLLRFEWAGVVRVHPGPRWSRRGRPGAAARTRR
jgi:DNA processing protein